MGRLLSKTLPDGSDVQYEYDQYGQLTAVEDGVTPLAWDYDPLGRLTAEHQGWASQYYRYDAQGQLTHWQLPDHNQLQYDYHPGGSLDRIHLNGQQLTRHHFQHGLERERQQGGVSSQFDYDDQGRLQAHRLQQQHSVRVERRYHYHATGNLAQTDDSRYGSTYYDYDPLDRLTSDANGHPIDHNNMTKRIWNPRLQRLGLRNRQPY
ncbi:hypothetical protein NFHSH190041_19170 [Shewanella sp. NFH-SH190041]|uniref:hypothetical protein n=1 Tax=Shewanella sp. NFH-SH190041 TaxID=2950245 RepID=UPI0021C2E53F|nr:hypothetical protein [Shewanella sp. NFH-SH190041]BDM64465.1 hypothetical protein NFHSH190041_19170 [Shewanella sp. NFH-SH190041]